MKKIISLLLIFTAINTTAKSNILIQPPPDSTTLAYWKNLDADNFKGLTVDSFLKSIPQNFDRIHITGTGRPEMADCVMIGYSDDIVLEVFIKQFTHMDNHTHHHQNPTRNWDINLARKEKIWFIKVWNLGICINGDEKEKDNQ